jgi:NAD(P)-dependent dehydrogenase (short-subunit alcohol dehydrogenase family)
MVNYRRKASALHGQVAIVTGAGRGFGRAIAERLVACGAAVCLIQRSQEELDEVAGLLPPDRAITVAGDVTNQDDVRRVISETEARLGPISLLVSNAGMHGPLGPIWRVDPEEWWRTQEVHLRGAFLFVNAVMPTMVERKTGRMITIASNVGLKPSNNYSAYAVSKASQIRLMESVALEGREHNVAAFALAPGTAMTDLNLSVMRSPDAQRWMPNLVKHLERIEAESDAEAALARCADVCADLASGRYDVLSGQYLDVAWDLDAKARELGSATGDD